MPRSRPLSHQSGGHPASHAKGKAHRRRHGLIAFLQGFWGRSVFSLIQGLFSTIIRDCDSKVSISDMPTLHSQSIVSLQRPSASHGLLVRGEALRRHIEADPALKVNATHGRSTAAKKMMFSTVIQFSLGIFGDAVLLKAGGGGGDRAEPRGRRRKGHAIDVQALLWACVGRLAGEQYEMLIVPGTAALRSTRGRNSRLRRIPHGNRCNNIGAPS